MKQEKRWKCVWRAIFRNVNYNLNWEPYEVFTPNQVQYAENLRIGALRPLLFKNTGFYSRRLGVYQRRLSDSVNQPASWMYPHTPNLTNLILHFQRRVPVWLGVFPTLFSVSSTWPTARHATSQWGWTGSFPLFHFWFVFTGISQMSSNLTASSIMAGFTKL